MYQGVTPTFKFIAPSGLDMSLASKVWVTFSTMDEREVLTKSGDELTVTESSVELILTQRETLKFPKDKVKVQLNWVYRESGEDKRACSNKIEIDIISNLKREVLNDEI